MGGPLGVFDSGFGGLTIFKGIRSQIPEYDFLYLGDNARTPYGNRSFETVLAFSIEAVNYLLKSGCPLVVVACNTASAKALRTIQQNWLPKHFPDRRVLGVIRPTAEAVSNFTKTKKVGLWATTGTVKSGSFPIEIEKLAPGVQVFQQACPLLVPLVEAGELKLETSFKDLILQINQNEPSRQFAELYYTEAKEFLQTVKAIRQTNLA